MLFPYTTYYPNQKEMIEFISSVASKSKNPVFESPTGSGKTIAVLTALIPIARAKGKKIIYFCRTHEQMDRVINELKMISRQEKVKGLSLRSRKDLCLNEFITENIQTTVEGRLACSTLKKEGRCRYYKNLGKGKLIKFEKPMTSIEVAGACRDLDVCPYEFLKGLLPSCDVISCSYLYIFEPEIRAAFLKSIESNLDELIIVLDEAHNLPKLALNIAGERISEFALGRGLKEAEDFGVPDAAEFLGKIHKFMLLNESDEQRLKKDPLLEYLGEDIKTAYELEDIGEEIRNKKLKQEKRPISFLHACASFILYWADCNEEEFAYFASKTKKGIPYLEVLSLEPKNITKFPLDEAYLSLHMSGTLTPIEPYCSIIGLSNYISKSFPSPFPKENIAALVDPSVSTLGSLRTREMYGRIASRIQTIASIIPGNVLVFFPSYVVLKSVLKEDISVKKELFVERNDMTSGENNEMIREFKHSVSAVLLGVQQGRNSEGQDFPGEQANAVIVVGIPYAVKGPKVKAQIEYYKKTHRGWWGKYQLGEYYAYFLPAYRSLNQSAGRAHRSLTDRAAIIFLEKRVAFDRKVLANISPWIKERIKVSTDIESEIERFYG
jgi:DNA excision repair protein ERCC-2